MIGCCVALKCFVACLFFESSQQPTWPQVRQMRRCIHSSPMARHSWQPSALGCQECLAIGDEWMHLRICRTCGHVGCCDDSKNRHATKHFKATQHPIIEGYDPPEGWGWCFVDEVLFDLSDRKTPHNGPIPRYY